MKIAYLACADVMPDAPERRVDAYEHDREYAALAGPIAARGGALIEADWRACDPAAFDLVFIRTTWDYTDYPAEFLGFLDRAAKATKVANAPELIRWNLSKRYLPELAAKGLPIIPSAFAETPTPLADIFDRLGADELVLKPVVGASGFGQERLTRGQAGERLMDPGLFAQPLIPEIVTWGEISMIFVAGAFSHAVRKTAAKGEYRIHVMHGGAEMAYQPTPAEIATAQAFVDALPVPALAARVDLVPHEGELLLMELEVIEPHLFPLFGPELGERIAAACEALLASRPAAGAGSWPA